MPSFVQNTNSKFARLITLILFVSYCTNQSNGAYNNPLDLTVRKAPRWNLPFLGLGIVCNGCPPRTCENDPAIIYGYCCGCAKALDRLPVLCPRVLDCPLNGGPLCHDYEYMMTCCC